MKRLCVIADAKRPAHGEQTARDIHFAPCIIFARDVHVTRESKLAAGDRDISRRRRLEASELHRDACRPSAFDVEDTRRLPAWIQCVAVAYLDAIGCKDRAAVDVHLALDRIILILGLHADPDRACPVIRACDEIAAVHVQRTVLMRVPEAHLDETRVDCRVVVDVHGGAAAAAADHQFVHDLHRGVRHVDLRNAAPLRQL